MGSNRKIGGGGYHHVALRVSDFDASLRFYVDGLGFRKAHAWGSGDGRAAMLDTGDGACLEIFSGGKRRTAPAPQNETAVLHVALRTSDCDGATAAARAAGARITAEPKNVDIPSSPPYAVRIAFCEGPDGEIIEFFQERS